jgi:hypothetical protein
LGKHCRDDGCPGVYDDDVCSHCGKTDPDTLPYINLHAAAGRYGHVRIPNLDIQVKLDDEGVVVDLYAAAEGNSIASTCKTYQDMQISVRRWYEGGDVNVKELLTQFKNGNRQEVITTLLEAHPCVTAMLLTVGMLEGHLRQEDCNIITNMLVDAKTEENE